MDVTVTEVTDPTVKHKVVIADAAHKTKTLFAFGEDRNREPTSLLVTLGIAKDDTPEGLASAVPRVAVFEVTPTSDTSACGASLPLSIKRCRERTFLISFNHKIRAIRARKWSKQIRS